MTTTDEFLAHHGVLGMHWGKRKAVVNTPEETRAEALKKLAKTRKKLDRVNGNTVVKGTMLRGYYGKKAYDKKVRTNPKFAYSHLSEAGKAEYDKKVTSAAYRGIGARTALDVGAAVAIGQMGGKYLFGLNSRNRNIATGVIAGTVLLGRLGQVHSINVANQVGSLHEDVKSLQAQTKTKP